MTVHSVLRLAIPVRPQVLLLLLILFYTFGSLRCGPADASYRMARLEIWYYGGGGADCVESTLTEGRCFGVSVVVLRWDIATIFIDVERGPKGRRQGGHNTYAMWQG
jgi:hypothetical protein